MYIIIRCINFSNETYENKQPTSYNRQNEAKTI